MGEVTQEDIDKEFEKNQTMENETIVNAWKPPKDQTGDGRTKLNEKLGY